MTLVEITETFLGRSDNYYATESHLLKNLKINPHDLDNLVEMGILSRWNPGGDESTRIYRLRGAEHFRKRPETRKQAA